MFQDVSRGFQKSFIVSFMGISENFKAFLEVSEGLRVSEGMIELQDTFKGNSKPFHKGFKAFLEVLGGLKWNFPR